ncbi:rhodanese-like domain-containing protein [Agromyces bauzanensis]|uniref:rhodanese-like domain-containing protein n=1 Tax=Agromyces bauzanensis TaxID=1308924 RepID=UPI00166DB6EE|nr:rhodanese-like domain-containing protein [Agromyces bauzanensis]
MTDTEAVDTDELVRRIDGGDAILLDVRPEPGYAGGHLPGAKHIPLEELTGRLSDLPRDREIVAYCRGRYGVLEWCLPDSRSRPHARSRLWESNPRPIHYE